MIDKTLFNLKILWHYGVNIGILYPKHFKNFIIIIQDKNFQHIP